MTKAEMEKQLKEQQEIIDKQKERVKTQNEKAKENWDTVSCRLPKGTKDRIKALGLTVNGVINESVLTYLDCMEEEQEQPEEPTKQPQTKPITKPTEEVPQEQPKEPQKAHREPTLEELQELQELINQKKAEQGINSEQIPEGEEKEKLRQESIIKSALPY